MIQKLYLLMDKLHEAPNEIGQTPYLLALTARRLENAETLRSLGANIRATDKISCNLLHYAARTGVGGGVRQALSDGIDVNSVDTNFWSALHWTAASNELTYHAIEELLQAGCDREALDKQGRTASTLADRPGKKLNWLF